MTDILIVDDEPDARFLLQMSIKVQLKADTREATNGLEALRLVEEHPPDLIILDMSMPVMDGATFLQEMRKNSAIADIPVVIFSAFHLTDEQAAQMEIPLERIMRKGNFKLKEMIKTIQGALGQPTNRHSQ